LLNPSVSRDGEIRPLDKRSAAMRPFWRSADFVRFHANAFRRRVANRGAAIRAVNLNELHVINFVPESILDGPQKNLVAIRRQLDAIGKPIGNVEHEVVGPRCLAESDRPRDHQL
jgi:hypothetical protein